MLISYEYTNRQRGKLNYVGDQIDYIYPMKLEEEEENDYEEIEKLKKKQKQLKDELLKKKKSEKNKIKEDAAH